MVLGASSRGVSNQPASSYNSTPYWWTQLGDEGISLHSRDICTYSKLTDFRMCEIAGEIDCQMHKSIQLSWSFAPESPTTPMNLTGNSAADPDSFRIWPWSPFLAKLRPTL